MSGKNETGQADPAQANRQARRRQMMLLGALVAGALLLSFTLTNVDGLPGGESGAGSRRGESVDIITAGQALEESDVWRGRAEAELLALRHENNELQAALDDLIVRVERAALGRQQPAWEEQITRDMLIGLQEQENASAGPEQTAWPEQAAQPEYAEHHSAEFGAAEHANPDVPPPQAASPEASAASPPPSREIEVHSTSMWHQESQSPEGATSSAAPPEEAPAAGQRRAHYSSRLPAGTFFRAVILGSLDAPTGQSGSSNPLPVLLRISRHAELPNSFRRDVRECFVTGAGYGDISSERAYIRTERMSCVMRDGNTADIPVKGYVAGEDGKTGVRGTLVSRQGQVLARSLFAGVMSGLGEAFHDRYSEIRAIGSLGGADTSVRAYPTGAGLQAGVARGAASSLEKLSDYYLALADQMHPIIEVAAGRTVDIILQEGIDLPDLHAPQAAQQAGSAAGDGGNAPSALEARYGSYSGRR